MNPPFVGVAVKVTGSPEQTGFADATMVTLTGRGLAAVIVIEFDQAGLPVTHDPRLEVMLHLTTSPFAGI